MDAVYATIWLHVKSYTCFATFLKQVSVAQLSHGITWLNCIMVVMKKRDKRKQAKLQKISLKRALYEKARKQKLASAKNKTHVHSDTPIV